MEAPRVANGIPMVKVVKEEFCVPHLVELIVKKIDSITSRMKYQISDVNGKVQFEVDDFQQTYRLKRRGKSMHDAAGFGLPVLILFEDKKHRHRWTVHRGGSSLGNEPLFSAQWSYTTEMRPRLEVFLPTSATEDICDFQIVEYYSSKFYKVYKDHTVIAEVLTLLSLFSLTL